MQNFLKWKVNDTAGLQFVSCFFTGTIFEGSMLEVVWAKPADKTDRNARAASGLGRGLLPDVSPFVSDVV